MFWLRDRSPLSRVPVCAAPDAERVGRLCVRGARQRCFWSRWPRCLCTGPTVGTRCTGPHLIDTAVRCHHGQESGWVSGCTQPTLSFLMIGLVVLLRHLPAGSPAKAQPDHDRRHAVSGCVMALPVRLVSHSLSDATPQAFTVTAPAGLAFSALGYRASLPLRAIGG